MLQNFRKYTQGWVATFLAVLISLAFAMWGIENYLRGSSHKNLVAKINGLEITASQVNADYQRMLLKVTQQTGAGVQLPPAVQQHLRNQALNDLVLQSVLTQSAVKAGFLITPYQSSMLIKQMPEFQDKGKFSKERFNRVISQLDYTQPGFINEIAKLLLVNQVVSGIVGTDFILPHELSQSQLLLGQKRSFQYILIDRKFPQIPPTEATITKYYMQHQEAFRKPAKVRLEYVQLQLADLKKGIQVSPAELTEYLSGNGAANPNDPSVLKQARTAVQEQKAEQAFSTASDRLSELAYTNPSSLAEAAQAMNLPVQVSDDFTAQGGNTALSKNPKVLSISFSDEFIKNGTNSNLIELGPGNVAIIKLKEYQPPQVAALSEVRNKIISSLANIQASEQARAYTESLLEKMSHEKNLASFGFKVFTKTAVSRDQEGIDARLLKAAFAIPPKEPKKVTIVELEKGKYALLSVIQIDNPDTNQDNPKQKAWLAKIYPQIYGQLSYQLYTAHQLSKAKVRYYKH